MSPTMRRRMFGFQDNDSMSSRSHSSDGDDGSFAQEDEVNDVAEVQKIAKRETQHVNAWRYIVVFMLVATATIVTVTSYVLLSTENEEDFHTSFRLFALTIEDSLSFHLHGVVEATEGLSELLTAHATSEATRTNGQPSAVSSTAAWPLVTLPNFEVYVEHSRSQASAESITFLPLVNRQNGDALRAWNEYAVANQGWIADSFKAGYYEDGDLATPDPIPNRLYDFAPGNATTISNSGSLPHAAAIWQMSPPPDKTEVVNRNALAHNEMQLLYTALMQSKSMVVSAMSQSLFFQHAFDTTDHDLLHAAAAPNPNEVDFGKYHPHSTLLFPVFARLHDEFSSIVGLVGTVMPWDKYLANLLPEGVGDFYVVVRNSCNQACTYRVHGPRAIYMGMGERQDPGYDHLAYPIDATRFFKGKAVSHGEGDCLYSFTVYPSGVLASKYENTTPRRISIIVACTFFLMAFVFCVYDGLVQLKNNKILKTAAHFNSIVTSLFPTTVRDRLFQNQKANSKAAAEGHAPGIVGKNRLKTFLASSNHETEEETDDDIMFKTKPIADLFPETTILFADIVGFTAWSSVREPSQVFTLLETIYRAFDLIAKRRRVFKVETVGDCYVAVTGLPEARKDHALAMARFAIDCLHKVHELTKRLEVILGPDTGDLSMRFGLHSGPVTAGVLRGERSRFQLFGDTMNTASRMESTGQRDHIHLSEETADLIRKGGKGHWLKERSDRVVAKGKGELKTFWLNHATDNSNTTGSGSESVAEEDPVYETIESLSQENANFLSLMSDKVNRLIDWNVEILARLLKQIIARRGALRQSTRNNKSEELHMGGGTVLEEVKEIITLPEFDARYAEKHVSPDSIILPPGVEEELREYVSNIAAMYKHNHFHNFEHASHVTMSVVKLMSRIVAPTDIECELRSSKKVASTLHDHTYGITSDPLTQFACVFSALIHDVDHSGVPNTQLIKEHPRMGSMYKGKSVAEQNSVDLAWNLLMDDNYSELRSTIYATSGEKRRFRQLVVNSVMATDILDKDLKTLRNSRWEKAFTARSESHLTSSAHRDTEDRNRKATIVIEHLIQASDVAHTMQHWHVYRKWNERLFQEMAQAYFTGRSQQNPADTWYEGELGFFDYYIIPLARKLKDCGVFGVSSDEYLTYAIKNRQEWSARGKEVVAGMVENWTQTNSTGQDS